MHAARHIFECLMNSCRLFVHCRKGCMLFFLALKELIHQQTPYNFVRTTWETLPNHLLSSLCELLKQLITCFFKVRAIEYVGVFKGLFLTKVNVLYTYDTHQCEALLICRQMLLFS